MHTARGKNILVSFDMITYTRAVTVPHVYETHISLNTPRTTLPLSTLIKLIQLFEHSAALTLCQIKT